jgi:predicted TPR repeat methyltransferase
MVLGIPHIGLRLRANKIMGGIPSTSERMLDAGFGTGVYSYTLSKSVNSIDAIDNEDSKVSYAKAVNPFDNIRFHKMDLTNLQFPDGSFDLVICSDVLEHISNDRLAFAELARVTKRGGNLLLTVPLDSQNNRKSFSKFDHQRAGYTEGAVKKLCEENGLSVIRTHTYSYSVAEGASEINYRIVNYKVVLLFLFYPLFAISRISDILFRIGEPNGIYFRILKRS